MQGNRFPLNTVETLQSGLSLEINELRRDHENLAAAMRRQTEQLDTDYRLQAEMLKQILDAMKHENDRLSKENTRLTEDNARLRMENHALRK